MKKIAVIGDIHGTTKFLECYKNIQKNDSDVDKIIVLGDWFDPYIDIDLDTMIDRYNEFVKIWKSDDRIISILGNHDIAGYIIYGDYTSRTLRFHKMKQRITDVIEPNLSESYLTYKVGDYIFSHAGVSQDWLNDISQYTTHNYVDDIMNCKKGWTEDELSDICTFYPYDFGRYGNNIHQSCVWIRPQSLYECAIDGYNQVVAHTKVKEITKISLKNGKDVWLVDDEQKPNYLILNIEENI
jgi:predicted MPP superfamily phosphohydrolase